MIHRSTGSVVASEDDEPPTTSGPRHGRQVAADDVFEHHQETSPSSSPLSFRRRRTIGYTSLVSRLMLLLTLTTLASLDCIGHTSATTLESAAAGQRLNAGDGDDDLSSSSSSMAANHRRRELLDVVIGRLLDIETPPPRSSAVIDHGATVHQAQNQHQHQQRPDIADYRPAAAEAAASALPAGTGAAAVIDELIEDVEDEGGAPDEDAGLLEDSAPWNMQRTAAGAESAEGRRRRPGVGRRQRGGSTAKRGPGVCINSCLTGGMTFVRCKSMCH